MKTLTNSNEIAQHLKAHLAALGASGDAVNNPIQSNEGVVSSRLLQDSRQIRQGDVFVALAGHDLNGADFIDAAIQNGAGAVLVDAACDYTPEPNNVNSDVLFIEVPALRNLLGSLCQSFYFSGESNQSQPLPVIGVTGTNGKTSITHLLAQIADLSKSNDDLSQSKSCAVIGTMGTGYYQALVPSANTTPGITDVYRLMAEFRQDTRHDYMAVAMEVSSHALAQGRVAGVEFETAIFTNLSHEHLDYHGTMEQYFAEKAKLFTDFRPANSVINIDDEYGLKLTDLLPIEQRVIAVGETKQTLAFAEYVWIKKVECHTYGLQIELEWQIDGAKETSVLNLPLYGTFNAANIAAVFATAIVSGWSFEAQSFTELVPVPGRLELFVEDDLPIAIVDYAHTPDALEASLKAAKAHLDGNLLLVFGCGGDRDTSKRPMMAKVAEKYANSVIVTNDNPRTESQEQIVNDIIKGFDSPDAHHIEYDRKLAIQWALEHAQPGDAVLIAGKGHETYQIIGQQVFDYDERSYVAGLMADLAQRKN